MNMNFTNNTKELEKLFMSVIRTVLNLFGDKRLFLSKLMFTELHVHDTEAATNSSISGVINGYIINMNINMNDGLFKILMQFGHELGHLICMPLSINPFNSFNKTDKSYAITTLTRVSKGVTYGYCFEELFCNYIACMVIEKIGISISEDDANYLRIIKRNTNIIRFIISAFEISEHEKWDKVIEDNIPCNSLLFGIANGDISHAIYLYDKQMGDGMWMQLMKDVYWYCYASECDEKQVMFFFIKQKADEFKDKYFRNIRVVA